MDERARDDADGPGPMLPVEPEPTPAAPRRNRLRRVGVGAVRTLSALISIGILGTMGYGWWTFGDVDEATVTTDVIDQEVVDTKVPLDGAVDLLLVGLDSRTDVYGNPLPRAVLDMLHAGVNEGERNTDTMILMHIPVDGTRAVAISFPRDSWVEIAGGFGRHKLNSAFAYAYNDARRDLSKTISDSKELERQAAAVGRKNLIATIEQLVGNAVRVDRYAEVNLASFYEVTNAIGGVEVCLNEPVRDWRSGANFPAGRQTISGPQALSFVRQRYGLPNGDFDRIMRQQVFLGALADKVLSADMLTSPTKVRELISAVQRSVVLSNGWELSTFAAQLQDLSSGNIDFYTIPTQGGAKIGGADVIRVDPDEVHRFVAALTRDTESQADRRDPDVDAAPPIVSPTTSTAPTTTTTTRTRAVPGGTGADPPPLLPPTAITVDVRNASETKGLAASVLDRLVRQGFRQGNTGDAPVAPVTVIRYPSGEQYNAQLVASALGGQLALEPDLSLAAGHVRVVLGTDYPAGQPQGLVNRQPRSTSSQPATPSSPLPPPIVAGRLTCVN